ncbi:MAG: hypothetical protein IJ461_07955, partial [Clostridia bacterium]|nr:hypothetical protein [Clostridia bacterium]
MADSLFDVFSRKENLKALMDKDMTTAEKFVQWVKRFGRQMREAMRRIRMRSPEARAMDEANQQAIKKDLNDADAIVEAYNWLMEEAKEQKARMRDQEGQKRDQEGRREAASGKYSAKPELGEIDSEQNLIRYW